MPEAANPHARLPPAVLAALSDDTDLHEEHEESETPFPNLAV
jgi:hypothetical protein